MSLPSAGSIPRDCPLPSAGSVPRDNPLYPSGWDQGCPFSHGGLVISLWGSFQDFIIVIIINITWKVNRHYKGFRD